MSDFPSEFHDFQRMRGFLRQEVDTPHGQGRIVGVSSHQVDQKLYMVELIGGRLEQFRPDELR